MVCIVSVKQFDRGLVFVFHKNEILDLEEKVKKTLGRKDEMIKKLQEDSQMKDISIQKYEELLAKQRKELLMNK